MTTCTTHNANGCCWRCSDQDPRWREWRIGAGLPEAAPNERRPLPRKLSWDEIDERRELLIATVDKYPGATAAVLAAIMGVQHGPVTNDYPYLQARLTRRRGKRIGKAGEPPWHYYPAPPPPVMPRPIRDFRQGIERVAARVWHA